MTDRLRDGLYSYATVAGGCMVCFRCGQRMVPGVPVERAVQEGWVSPAGGVFTRVGYQHRDPCPEAVPGI